MNKSNVLKLITYSIGFQQFPVINIFGCFKIYELLGLFLLSKFKWQYKSCLFSNGAFIFFVLSPIVSFFFSIIMERPYSYYELYPDTIGTIKFDSMIFPLLQMVFMMLNFVVLAQIVSNKNYYRQFDTIRKNLVYIGTFIAFCSLFNMFVFDVFQYLPSIIQNKHHYDFRSSGFSIEPSSYVLYQTWITLFTFYSKELFRKKTWRVFMFINILSLVLTISSTLAALAGILVITPLVCRLGQKQRLSAALLISLGAAGLIYLCFYSEYSQFFTYFLIEKIENLFTATDHTMDSGAFRAYTSRIGIEIFKDYPLWGVGVGNSIYYMHNYDAQMGIIHYGETLTNSTMPLNLISCILAEQGILGGIGLFCMLWAVARGIWKYRNQKPFGHLFFIGCLFNFVIFTTCPTAYSMYLWLFMAITIGFIKNRQEYIHENSNRLSLVRK